MWAHSFIQAEKCTSCGDSMAPANPEPHRVTCSCGRAIRWYGSQGPERLVEDSASTFGNRAVFERFEGPRIRRAAAVAAVRKLSGSAAADEVAALLAAEPERPRRGRAVGPSAPW